MDISPLASQQSGNVQEVGDGISIKTSMMSSQLEF
jgi:hypothetical protein